ncbi:MAG: hypothetical protein WCV72_02505 [Patescibacteria group bacterium]
MYLHPLSRAHEATPNKQELTLEQKLRKTPIENLAEMVRKNSQTVFELKNQLAFIAKNMDQIIPEGVPHAIAAKDALLDSIEELRAEIRPVVEALRKKTKANKTVRNS